MGGEQSIPISLEPGTNKNDPECQHICEKVKKLIRLMYGEKQFKMAFYHTLNTKIKPLQRGTDEYENILRYIKNTTADTLRSNYDKFIIQDIYSASRKGEYIRMKDGGLRNHRMLWHGTKLKNYPTILKHGLLTSPPDSVRNFWWFGNSFGDGIYFSDCVTESAKFCNQNGDSSDGILILAEVALGNVFYKRRGAKLSELPRGKNSVKALGMYTPTHINPMVRSKYGVLIPLGPLKRRENFNSAFDFNEYIVYNENQVLIQYLVHIKFI